VRNINVAVLENNNPGLIVGFPAGSLAIFFIVFLGYNSILKSTECDTYYTSYKRLQKPTEPKRKGSEQLETEGALSYKQGLAFESPEVRFVLT
jgi:hypothetical protein